MVALRGGLWFSGQEVERRGACAGLQNLESCIPQEARPAFPSWKAGMRKQRTPGQVEPQVFGDDHQQKLAAGFQHAGGFAEGLTHSVAVQVVDGVGADDAIEGGRFDGHLAHVAGLDGSALLDAGGFQVFEQPLAALIGHLLSVLLVAEMAHVFLAETVERHHERARAAFQNHEGRAAGARAHVEDAPGPGRQERFGGQRHASVHVHAKTDRQEGDDRPEGYGAQDRQQQLRPPAGEAQPEEGQDDSSHQQVPVGPIPGVAEVYM